MGKEAKVISAEGTEKGRCELDDALFGVTPNHHVLHASVVSILANMRQGTSSTKNRSDVRGGGRKPWRQKGTGRARTGTIRAPHWKGGGHSFAKDPKEFDVRLPKRQKRIALKSALSIRAGADDIIITENLSFDSPSTKRMVQILRALGAEEQKVLLVLPEFDTNVWKSLRNIPDTKLAVASSINPWLVMNCQKLVITESALTRIGEVFGEK
jgi:large subunit ribosomal protein L4